MSIIFRIALGLFISFISYIIFYIGRTYESYHNVGYLQDGTEFIFTKDGMNRNILGRYVSVKKLPNGFYKEDK